MARRSFEPVFDLFAPVLSLAIRAAVRLRVTGLGNVPLHGPALLVANHVSYLDPVVLLVLAHRRGRRLRVLAVEEAFERAFVGWFMRAGGQIPVPRGSGRTSALHLAGEALRCGELVLVYPEGTIPAPGRVVPAKSGVGRLALGHAVPVIPIGTYGLERRRSTFHRRFPRRFPRRRLAAAVIGAPVDVSAISTGGDPQQIADVLLERVRALAVQAQRVATDVAR